MLNDKHINTIIHYVGGFVLVLALFFAGDSFMQHRHAEAMKGGTAFVQPMPQLGAAAALDRVAQALKDKAFADALAGRNVDLSAAQSTLASTISQATGINSRLAGALAEGLTRPAPKVQVITVKTDPKASFAPIPIVATDDNIKKDLKEVLATSTVNVNTHVDVTWQDKPLSPIFAAYGSSGASGAGYSLHRTNLLDLDALLLHKDKDFQLGVGVEHRFRGTSAGIGLAALEDLGVHRSTSFQAYVAIHF